MEILVFYGGSCQGKTNPNKAKCFVLSNACWVLRNRI